MRIKLPLPESAANWGRITLACGFVLVLLTLFPYNFSLERVGELQGRSLFPGLGGDRDWDIVENVLLFAPLGFALGSWLDRRFPLQTVRSALVACLAGAAIAYAIECAQVFLPRRYPSLIDVGSNTAGTLLGWVAARWWKARRLDFALAGYVAAAFLLSIPLQRATTLVNWDRSFPLILGNERTGDRPWEGRIRELYILDQAVVDDEARAIAANPDAVGGFHEALRARYRFTGANCGRDETGHLPDLVCWGRTGGEHCFGSVGSEGWLQTSAPITALNQQLARTSQFTIGVTLATANPVQDGPARIVSISRDPNRRNVTLGQQDEDLVVRLRTPLSGINGVNPELRIPGVFSDTAEQQLAVVYDGSDLRVYVNGELRSERVRFGPGTAAFGSILPRRPRLLPAYEIFFYGIVFCPAGVLLALAREASERRSLRLLSVAFLIAAPALYEGMLVAVSGKSFYWPHVLVGIAFIGFSFVAFETVRSVSYSPVRLKGREEF